MTDLLEIGVEIAKIINYQGSALSGVVCLTRLVSGPKSPQKVLVLEKGLVHDC